MKMQFHTTLNKNARIGLAISGGMDSVVLLHLLVKEGFHAITLLHVNYGLRGNESDEDELFLRNLTKEKGLEIKVFNAKNKFKKKTGIQEKARQIRYEWFDKLLEEKQIDFVLTAHHQNDVSETVLLNLFRKTGLSGLSGISNQAKIIRPLLPFSRQEIEVFAKENNLTWRTDSSNQKSDYKRNFIRNKIIPSIEEQFPNAVRNIYETSLQVKQEKDLLKSLLETNNTLFWKKQTAFWGIIDTQILFSLPHPALLLYHLTEHMGFNREQCEEMTKSIRHKRSGQLWHGKGFDSCTGNHVLYFVKKAFAPLQTTVHWKLGQKFSLYSNGIALSTCEQLPDSSVLYLPNEMQKASLTLRSWKQGDSMQLSTDGKSKKLSDLFTEHKIPVLLRKTIPVLLLNNEIIWVAGLRISARLASPQYTKKEFSISIKGLLLPDNTPLQRS